MTLIVDTSAILAILQSEPEELPFLRILGARGGAAISAGNVIELHRVVQRRSDRQGNAAIERLFRRANIEIAPVDAAQAALARDGMERFGKGRGAPPAVLNFGDLFAYALARARQAPLLFKGDDFSTTDVIPAWTP